MAALEFTSTVDGSQLSFSITSRQEREILFDVAVKTPAFSGTALASTYVVASPADFFREMAAAWKGWEHKKAWCDVENRVAFEATSDHTGHVTLKVSLTAQENDAQLRVRLKFEAGQLEAMADQVAALFAA
jgi:hypothetical protein